MRRSPLPPIKSLLAVLLLVTAAPAVAQTPEEQGHAIAVEADRRDTGWGDATVNLKMTLKNAHGDVSTRALRNRLLEQPQEGDKSLIVFDDPADVKGTALLTYSYKTAADDQWLYLPALKRVKRIASNNKAGPFMGSEFAYEDLSSPEVEKFRYRYVGEESLEGEDCFVIERFPVDADSGYTRQVAWLDKAHYRVRKVDFYDRKESLLKTLTASGYQQYQDKYWRAGELSMVNHQTGKSTVLSFSDYRFGTGLGPRDFDRNSLEKVR